MNFFQRSRQNTEGLPGSKAEKGSVRPCKPALLLCWAAASSSRAELTMHWHGPYANCQERKSQNLGFVPERQWVRRGWGNYIKRDVIKCDKIMAIQGMIDLGIPLFPAFVMWEKKTESGKLSIQNWDRNHFHTVNKQIRGLIARGRQSTRKQGGLKTDQAHIWAMRTSRLVTGSAESVTHRGESIPLCVRRETKPLSGTERLLCDPGGYWIAPQPHGG